MQDGVGIQEVDRRAGEDRENVRMEDEVRLVDLRVFLGRGERLSRDRRDRDDGVGAVPHPLAGDLPVDVSREDRRQRAG